MPKPAASRRRTSGRAHPPTAAVGARGKKRRARKPARAKGNGHGMVRSTASSRTSAATTVAVAEPPAGAASEVVPSRGKYVYCIIESADPLRFGPIGIGAEPTEVYTVHYRNLGAVVSDAPLEVLDSTRENVLAHERVNETVMREHTVIPMSF
jgi:hypothetical protein